METIGGGGKRGGEVLTHHFRISAANQRLRSRDALSSARSAGPWSAIQMLVSSHSPELNLVFECRDIWIGCVVEGGKAEDVFGIDPVTPAL
jgi:hypothetical protein